MLGLKPRRGLRNQRERTSKTDTAIETPPTHDTPLDSESELASESDPLADEEHLNIQVAPRAPILTAVLLFVGSVLFSYGIGYAAVRYQLPITPATYRLLTFGLEVVGILIPALVVARMQAGSIAEGIRLKPVRPMAIIAAAFGVLCVVYVAQGVLLVQELYLIPERWLPFYLAERARITSHYFYLLSNHDIMSLFGSIVVATLVPGICEETMYRGAIQRSMEWRLRPWQAIVFAALLFALMHLQLSNFIVLAMIGAYFGYLAWRTGSIIPSMVAHALFNAMMIAILWLVPGAPAKSVHTSGQLVASLPVIAIALTLLIFIIGWFNRNYGRDQAIAIDQ